MSVTLGFAMRIGDFPTAAMVPPAPPPVQAVPAPIEAQVVSESGSSSTRSAIFSGRQSSGMHGQQYFRNHGITYTSRGSHSAPSEHSGRFLDFYA